MSTTGAVGTGRVVAVVPAFDREDTIGATVSALLSTGRVDEVIVVDDGSTDGTATAASTAGATVLRLPTNGGKGAALRHGVAWAAGADVVLLVDADLGDTAAATVELIEPVTAGAADLAVAALPSAGGRGGFGRVRDLAAWGIERATGFRPRAPLSGQRALRADLLRDLRIADGFAVETAMTIDARRAGARVIEVDLPIEHRHTGRTVAGFVHRGRQGVDVLRALWPRLTTVRQRLVGATLLFALAASFMVWSGDRWEASSAPVTTRPQRVVIFGMPGIDFRSLTEKRGLTPNLTRLIDRGSLAAMSVRTFSGRPTTVEGYTSLGAGARVPGGAQAGYAFNADEPVEGGTALEALARRTGGTPEAAVVVPGAPAVVRRADGRNLPSLPGALGQALAASGRRVAVVGNADTEDVLGLAAATMRPTAIALMDAAGTVDLGRVDRKLLRRDPAAPFGLRADRHAVLAALRDAMAAEVVLVDPGDIDRADAFAAVSTEHHAEAARDRATRDADALLGDVARLAGEDSLLVVVSVRPADTEWRLTPLVMTGPGIPAGGTLHSPSTRRAGVVTLTDIAPTVLHAMAVEVPTAMIGHPLRVRPDAPSLTHLRDLDQAATYREAIYLPITVWYIVLQALAYVVALVAFTRFAGAGRLRSVLRLFVLAVAAHPLGTFVLRAIPAAPRLGWGGVALLVAIDVLIAVAASRLRRRPLAPLQLILGATIALLLIDVATGARLQTSSILGYSLHTAARFTGFGNTAFATLASTTVLFGALWVHHAERRREALYGVALLFALVVLADGAPMLGSDVGGILTLVPVFGLTLVALAGRRVSWRAVVAVAVVALLALTAAAVVDVLRPEDARTHLGRLAADIQDEGLRPLATTVGRKLATNFRTYRSPWTWSVVVVTVYMLFVLVWDRGWVRLLPNGSAVRAGTIGALSAGLLGYATNDSGIVVTALVFVFLGPYLTLLALDGHGPPEVIAARPVEPARQP